MTEPRLHRPRKPRAPSGKRAEAGARAGAATPQDQPPALDVLRNRPFLFLWLAQVSTQVSGYMVLYGLILIIEGAYSSNTANGALLLSFLIPSVIFSAIAGVYVDRLDRRLVLVVTNVLRGVAYLAIVLVGTNLIALYLLVIFVATTTTFFGPAEASMIPILVRRDQLLPANALFTLTMNAAFAVGFALLGPFVVSFSSPALLIVVVGLLYFAAAVLCWTLPPAPPEIEGASPGLAVAEAEKAVESLFAQLREGLDYIRANPPISWSMLYLGVSAALVGVLGALGPQYATKTLGLGEKDFVVVALPLGIGVVTGILALNAYSRYVPRRRMIEGGLIALGFLVGLLAVAGSISAFLVGSAQRTGFVDAGRIVSLLGVVIAIGFLAGMAYIAVAVSAQTGLQEELREDARGRVFGILNMLVSIASFLPIIVVAPAADLIGNPSPVLLAVAVLIALTGVASILLRPSVAQSARVEVPTLPQAHAPVDPLTAAMAGEFHAHGESTPRPHHEKDPNREASPSVAGTATGSGAATGVVATPREGASTAEASPAAPVSPPQGPAAPIAPPPEPAAPIAPRPQAAAQPDPPIEPAAPEPPSVPPTARPATGRFGFLHRGQHSGTPRPRGVVRRSVLEDGGPSLKDRLRRIRGTLGGHDREEG